MQRTNSVGIYSIVKTIELPDTENQNNLVIATKYQYDSRKRERTFWVKVGGEWFLERCLWKEEIRENVDLGKSGWLVRGKKCLTGKGMLIDSTPNQSTNSSSK